jgi:hypothetical protein
LFDNLTIHPDSMELYWSQGYIPSKKGKLTLD